MHIVKASKKDINRLVTLWGRLSDSHRSYIDYMQPSSHWKEYMWNYFENELSIENRIIYIALENERNIGFVKAELRMTPEVFNNIATGYISEIYIEEEYRGSGLALQLMDYAILWAKNMGAVSIRLNVNSQNERGIGFYKKLGFKEVNKTLALKI